MYRFLVCMKVESEGLAEDDLEITKSIQAPCRADALELARARVRAENAEINTAKIWAWSIEGSRLAA